MEAETESYKTLQQVWEEMASDSDSDGSESDAGDDQLQENQRDISSKFKSDIDVENAADSDEDGSESDAGDDTDQETSREIQVLKEKKNQLQENQRDMSSEFDSDIDVESADEDEDDDDYQDENNPVSKEERKRKKQFLFSHSSKKRLEENKKKIQSTEKTIAKLRAINVRQLKQEMNKIIAPNKLGTKMNRKFGLSWLKVWDCFVAAMLQTGNVRRTVHYNPTNPGILLIYDNKDHQTVDKVVLVNKWSKKELTKLPTCDEVILACQKHEARKALIVTSKRKNKEEEGMIVKAQETWKANNLQVECLFWQDLDSRLPVDTMVKVLIKDFEGRVEFAKKS